MMNRRRRDRFAIIATASEEGGRIVASEIQAVARLRPIRFYVSGAIADDFCLHAGFWMRPRRARDLQRRRQLSRALVGRVRQTDGS